MEVVGKFTEGKREGEREREGREGEGERERKEREGEGGERDNGKREVSLSYQF